MSGNWGEQLLDLWETNVIPFLLTAPGSSLLHFKFHHASNIFSWWNVYTAGRPVRHLDSFMQGLPWVRCNLNGSTCCCKTFLHWWFLSRWSISTQALLSTDNKLDGPSLLLSRRHGVHDFQKEFHIFILLTNTVSHFASVHFKRPIAQLRHFWIMFTYSYI